MSQRLFRIGSGIFFVIALGHALCLFALESMFAFYHVTALYVAMCSVGAWVPYAITTILVVCFVLAGLYGLSAAGDLFLPLTPLAIRSIDILFAMRWIVGVGSLWVRGFSWLEISNLLIITLILVCYAYPLCSCQKRRQV